LSITLGIRAFFDGMRAARRPGLGRYIWLPALVSLVIIAAGLALTFNYIGDLTAWLTAQLPGWLEFLSLIVAPLLYLLGILIGTWLFAFLAVLLASPFLGDLSVAVEHAEFGSGPRPQQGLVAGALTALGREARKMAYFLPWGIVVLVLSLVPVLNTLAPLLWFTFGAWAMAVQFSDYPTENRGHPFRETVTLLQKNRSAALGFGACATVALAIPLINFLLIPAAVAGGTILYRRLQTPD
jgi:CysZ protein